MTLQEEGEKNQFPGSSGFAVGGTTLHDWFNLTRQGALANNKLPDGDLGLLYMNARFYLPGTGRFASTDTIVPDPNDQFHLKPYGLRCKLR